jgi:hypothetical protein
MVLWILSSLIKPKWEIRQNETNWPKCESIHITINNNACLYLTVFIDALE